MKWMKIICLIIGTVCLVVIPTIAQNVIKFRVTNYHATKKECGSTRGDTSSGHKVNPKICAADWRIYPPGTVIQLDTGERLVVGETGSKVKGRHHLDRFQYGSGKNDIPYPIVSRGTIIRMGDRKWSSNRSRPYRAVKDGLKLIEKIHREKHGKLK